MRRSYLRNLAFVCFAVVLIGAVPAGAESVSAKQIVRQSAMAYQQLESYQDTAFMQTDMSAALPAGIPEAQKQQMLEMGKMNMDFAYKKPKQFCLNLKSFMFAADSYCDGTTLTYLIGNFMGQPLNQYIQRSVESKSIDQVFEEMTESFGSQLKGQSQQSDLVYSMLLADNPLEAFSKMIESLSPDAVREKKQIRVSADQSEIKDVYMLQGKFVIDESYAKGVDATVHVTVDAQTHLIYGYEVEMKMDMREMKKSLPPQAAAAMKDDEMKFGLTIEHIDIKLNEDVPKERFVFTAPEGSQLVDGFDLQELMGKAMANIAQGGTMPGAPGGVPGAMDKPSTMIQAGGSVGKAAGDFKLTSLDGQTISLSQYKGRPVVLAFLASWSGSCKRQAPLVEKVFVSQKDQGAAVVGIFSERAEDKIKEFATAQSLTFPVVVDPDKTVMKDFSVTTWPSFVLIDKDGNVKKELPGMRTDQEIIEAINALTE